MPPDLLSHLGWLNYHVMAPIQAQALPEIFSWKDVIGQGKTAAFGLAVLQHLDMRHFSIQPLVLCPTHELADQVSKNRERILFAISREFKLQVQFL